MTLKDNNAQDVNPSNADINNLLALTFSNANLYYETNDSGNTSSFSIPSGITLNNDILKVDVSTGQGKLVGSSAQSNIGINGEGVNNITGEDQFLFPLKISEGYTFTNNIKNPGLRAVVYPRDAFDAYIGLELYETNASNAPRITNLDTAYGEADGYGGPEGTLRHGKTMNGDPFDGLTQETHPVAGSFQVSALDDSQTNPYDGIGNINFAFDQNTTIEESTGTHTSKLIVKERAATGDIIGLRLDRFPRYGIDYTVIYSHKLNKTSGIFNSDGNPVIVPTNSFISLPVNNQLQEVTGTVGKFKVYYPPQIPTTWSNPSVLFGQQGDDGIIPYENYSAYYYVDITFKRGNTPALITAKYNDDPETYQTQTVIIFITV